MMKEIFLQTAVMALIAAGFSGLAAYLWCDHWTFYVWGAATIILVIVAIMYLYGIFLDWTVCKEMERIRNEYKENEHGG